MDILGDPGAAIRSMAIPFLISLTVLQLNIFSDTFWVSNLGVKALSGMTSASPIYLFIPSIGLGLSTAIVTTIAYNIGKGDTDKAGRLAGNTIALAIILPLICSGIMYLLMDTIIGIMGAEDVSEEIHMYLIPFLLLSPFHVLNTAFGGMLRAEGAANRSTTVQLSSVVLNMIIDPLFIYGLDLGLTGASLATMVSYMFGVAISTNWYVRGKTQIHICRRDLIPRKETVMELMGVGGPRVAEGFINNGVVIIQRIFIIAASGTVGMTLFNVPYRYISLSMCPVEALSMAAIPVIAANHGKNDAGRMREARRTIYRYSLMISISLALVIIVFSPILMSVFTLESSMSEWYDELLWNIRMYAIVLPLMAIQYVSSSVLQSLRKTRLPMRVTLIAGVFRIFAFWIACPYGYQGITYALIVSYILSALLMLIISMKRFSRTCDSMGTADPQPSQTV